MVTYRLIICKRVYPALTTCVTTTSTVQVITAASISSRILAYYAFLLVLVPYLAAKVITVGDTFKLYDGIEKLGETLVALVPGRLVWIVDLIPHSFWLALPEKIINLAFVRILLHQTTLSEPLHGFLTFIHRSYLSFPRSSTLSIERVMRSLKEQ
jgi:hypothetical protein